MTEPNLARPESGTLPSYSQLLSLARRWRAQRAPATDSEVSTRVAILGNSTLQFLRDPLEYLLAQRGIRAELFVGEFDNHVQEILTEQSRLYEFQPQVVVLLLDHHAVKDKPKESATWADTSAVARAQLEQIQSLWNAIRSRCGASIVQSNIALPIERSIGHLSVKTPGSQTALLRLFNELLAESALNDVSILDIEHLSGVVGKRVWFDSATWYTSHQSFGFSALPELAQSLTSVVAGILGKTRKCLVLDLDNTLWGGTIGDAGVNGIQLGMGDTYGEPFVDFQKYCLELKQRGVLLAVCSKNEDANARQPFLSHPDTVLKLEDFSAFVANWDDKATNIRRIARELNLGLDSFVFVDDNPAERQLVRTFLPEVAVPEMPEDPALYRLALDRGHHFEVSTISADDRQRTNYYAAEQQRRDAVTSSTNMTEYVESLQQECEVGICDEATLPRILQLLNKTNQWNLTTRRFVENELRALMNDPAAFIMWLRSRDRFGDNGLVSVVIAREVGNKFLIEDWVMSCRVFQRGIENLVFNKLLHEARSRRLDALEGRYLETAKNKLVAEWYQTLGFTSHLHNEPTETRWYLELNATVGFRPHFIKHLQTSLAPSQETSHESHAA